MQRKRFLNTQIMIYSAYACNIDEGHPMWLVYNVGSIHPMHTNIGMHTNIHSMYAHTLLFFTLVMILSTLQECWFHTSHAYKQTCIPCTRYTHTHTQTWFFTLVMVLSTLQQVYLHNTHTRTLKTCTCAGKIRHKMEHLGLDICHCASLPPIEILGQFIDWKNRSWYQTMATKRRECFLDIPIGPHRIFSSAAILEAQEMFFKLLFGKVWERRDPMDSPRIELLMMKGFHKVLLEYL